MIKSNIKSQFKIFNKNKDLTLLDSGATVQKSQHVISVEKEFNEEFYGAVGRGNCNQSISATERYENAKNVIANFVGTKKENISFNAGATEGLNIIAYGIKHLLKKGDEILISTLEHNSNVLPWMRLGEEIGIKLKFAKLNQNQEITFDEIKKNITKKTKIISLAHISNVTGQILPIEKVGKLAKEKGIMFFIDACQSAPHIKLDINKFNASGLVFSAHKLGGPTGIGALYLNDEIIEKIKPINLGGGIVAGVSQKGYKLIKEIEKLESGTPPVSQSIGFAEACKFLENFGYENLEKIEKELLKYGIEKLKSVKGLKIVGPKNMENKSGIISFYFDNIHTHDIACALAEKNICVRSGFHCADIAHQELGIGGTTRISFWMYNEKKDIDKLVEILNKVVDIFK